MDRTSLDLPGDQDQLIEAVARANRNTIVVLNTGGPCSSAPSSTKLDNAVEFEVGRFERRRATSGDVASSGVSDVRGRRFERR